eukprot:s1692_g1.t1
MLLWSLASMSGKGPVGFMMELPADEERLRECDPHHVSVWELELWKAFKSVGGMRMVSFNMGVFGHKGKRPTTIGTNYPDFYDLDGNWDFADSCVPSSLVSKEEKRQWPLRFRALVVEALKEGMDGSFAKEEELIEAGAKVSKLSKEQKAEWQQHLLNDHQPYRADCSVCINAQAYGYKHRRRKMPGLYSLALDLAGPFKQKGRDTEFDDYKYVMVAAYRCPREYMSATAIPEYEKELYVPDEPEELSVSGGEDSDSDPIGPETLEEAVKKLNQGEETATIYVTRPLRRRTAHHVLQAAKEILLQLRQSGLHVDVVHTDRAREFKAKSFKGWTVDSKLRHTKTAGGDPSGNSTAELGVKWAKSRMRALLKGAKVSAKEWPMAVNHASSSLWAKAFPFSPWTTQPATTFGNEVWLRSKVYQGKAEKKHEAVGTRWKKGWYGGPLSEVKRGHVILRDDGGLTIAKSVKLNVIDPDDEYHGILPPATAEGLPEESLCDEHPPTRKQLKEEIEFRSRNMLDNKNYSLENVVQLCGLLELLGDTDRRILEKSSFSSWYTGDPVALEPPAIAYELGLAERGDMWQVKQAIYGLRESPALWSKFRDNELRKARWMINLNDEPLLMKMEQLITDDQIWSIAREDGKDTETYGYVLVYIDDLLIQSDDQNLQGFFQWLSAKWAVDALDILQEGHPIRFLGMELHQVQGAVELCQEGFIRELLKSYKHDGSRSTSQGQRELLILSHEEEQALLESEPANLEGLEAEVKQAQKRVGELMTLKAKAQKAQRQKLTKAELKELQRLLSLSPNQLSSDQMRRMCELKEKFEETMPPNSSPDYLMVHVQVPRLTHVLP